MTRLIRVLDHHDRVRSWRQRGAGHDGNCLPRSHFVRPRCRITRFDFCNDLKPRGNGSDIAGAHGISIASGSGKWRKIPIGDHSFCKYSPGSRHQVDAVSRTSRDSGGVLFDQSARVFEGENWCRWRG